MSRFRLDQLPARYQAQLYPPADPVAHAAALSKPKSSSPLSLVPKLDKRAPMALKTSKQATPRHDESRSQQDLIRWWRDNCHEWNLDEELLMAFPLQGARSARNGARMKAEGMRRGTPDLLLAVPRGECVSLWIEMKTPKGYLNPFQRSMLKRLTDTGHATCVCRSTQEATDVITTYLNIVTGKT